MNQPKEILNSAMNQINLLHNDMQSNITEVSKKYRQMNPLKSMQVSWQISQFRKSLVEFYTLPIVISKVFFDTWSNVYSPEGK